MSFDRLLSFVLTGCCVFGKLLFTLAGCCCFLICGPIAATLLHVHYKAGVRTIWIYIYIYW